MHADNCQASTYRFASVLPTPLRPSRRVAALPLVHQWTMAPRNEWRKKNVDDCSRISTSASDPQAETWLFPECLFGGCTPFQLRPVVGTFKAGSWGQQCGTMTSLDCVNRARGAEPAVRRRNKTDKKKPSNGCSNVWATCYKSIALELPFYLISESRTVPHLLINLASN